MLTFLGTFIISANTGIYRESLCAVHNCILIPVYPSADIPKDREKAAGRVSLDEEDKAAANHIANIAAYKSACITAYEIPKPSFYSSCG